MALRRDQGMWSIIRTGIGVACGVFGFILLLGWCAKADEPEGIPPQILEQLMQHRHERTGCMPAEELSIAFTDTKKHVSKLRPVESDLAAGAVTVFDEFPPAGKTKFKEAWLADIEGGGGFLFVGIHGMVCARIQVQPDDWKVILAKFDGQGT